MSMSCSGDSPQDILSQIMTLSPEEEHWFTGDEPKLSFKSSPYFLDLARKHAGIRRQVIPREEELYSRPYESTDPLWEAEFSPLPRMVHRYPNRVAVLVTDRCAVHCRHCFRRAFTGKNNSDLTIAEQEAIISYLKEHPEVKEVLLTGGDPLTLSDASLFMLLERFRECRSDLVLRLGTRIPSVLPRRISPKTARELGGFAPLWLILHFNHPAELTEESRRALTLLRESGVPMVSQTVLLRGVNDDSDTLAELFQGLLGAGVKPYYLFQGDLAAGTSHLRVPLGRGWEIMDELRQKVSGLALPRYAVDLPGGGGKIPLDRSQLVGENERGFIFRNSEGREFTYPREEI